MSVSNHTHEPDLVHIAEVLPHVLPERSSASIAYSSAPGACGQCFGAGYYKKAVPYTHPEFGVLFPCQCKQAEHVARQKAALAALSNLASFSDRTFATFKPDVPGVRRAYLRAVEYARQLDGWLALFGGYGVGKTHLAAAIANEVLARDVQVIFAVVPDLLDHLRATFAPTSAVSYDQRFELIRTAPLLVLDDLGTEHTTPWAREKLYQVVNHRYNERLPTVFTSNLEPDEIDPRIYSRMCDPCIGSALVQISATDYRKRLMKS
jgi:DNA replication protein DnaC